jgi:hypothetical protein
MTDEQTLSLEAVYAEALQLEREALHRLQAQEPGSGASTEAWQAWSEAITRTNRAWRDLSSHTPVRPPQGLGAMARASVPGAGAPSR